MVLYGHVRNGVVVLDTPHELPEGVPVKIELVAPAENPQPPEQNQRQGGQWQGQVVIASDFDELPDDLADAFGSRSP